MPRKSAAAKAAEASAEIAAPEVVTPKASGETISVACKLPGGLLLRLFKMVPAVETVPGGYREIQKAELIPGQVKINGNALAYGEVPGYRILGGYAITENVSKEFFDEWMKQNRDHPAVRNNLVFAVGRGDEAAPTKEKEEVRSGLEPLLQDKDPRAPGRIVTADVKA